MENPTPPLFTNTPRCYTCGKVLSHKGLLFTNRINTLMDNETSKLPNRMIKSEKLPENLKTLEGKILDELGVFKYCCRSKILTEPKNKVHIE